MFRKLTQHKSVVDLVTSTVLLEEGSASAEDVLILDCGITVEAFETHFRPLLDKGFRFIYNHSWESLYHNTISDLCLPYQQNGIAFFGYEKTYPAMHGWDDSRSFYIPMYFWYHGMADVLRAGGPRFVSDSSNAAHSFLMPLHLHKPAREQFLQLLGHRLSNSIYSKGWEQKWLPGEPSATKSVFSHLNRDWYNDTHYSLVVESWQEGPVFITEKTFKPIQFGHPFMILGVPGTLRLLKQYGFETFPGLFDETYDNEPDLEKRMQMLVRQVDDFDANKLQSIMLSVRRNWNRYHNVYEMRKLISKEVNDPLRRFFSS